MLVILKHEKPIKDLPDLVADRLSKMEGVDGSGVTVATFDAVAGKDFIVRAEALEDARYRGDAVEVVAAQRATPFPAPAYVMQSNGTGLPIRERSDNHPPGYDFTEPEVMIKVTNYGTPSPVLTHPTDDEKHQLAKAIEAMHVTLPRTTRLSSTTVTQLANAVEAMHENLTVQPLTAEELDALAREWTKDIGDESNMVQVFRGLHETVWMDKHDRADMSAEEREYARRVFEKKTR